MKMNEIKDTKELSPEIISEINSAYMMFIIEEHEKEIYRLKAKLNSIVGEFPWLSKYILDGEKED